MNIFALDVNPEQAARWHVDTHVVKMPLEYAQLLSTAHILLDNRQVGYKATHQNHPSARWARLSRSTYLWLYDLFVTTSLEYTFRYGRDHKSFTDLSVALSKPPENLLEKGFVLPFPAMPDDFVVPGNSILSYRNYYNQGKRHLHSWTLRKTPKWITP